MLPTCKTKSNEMQVFHHSCSHSAVQALKATIVSRFKMKKINIFSTNPTFVEQMNILSQQSVVVLFDETILVGKQTTCRKSKMRNKMLIFKI